MIANLLAWAGTGTVELLLLLIIGPSLVLPAVLQRWSPIDTALSTLATTVLLGLGFWATHQRLLALSHRLDDVPGTQIVGMVAMSEARAAELLAASLVMAGIVGAAWAWRRTSPGESLPLGPSIVTTLSFFVAISVSTDRMWWVAGFNALVVMGSSLRPHSRWAASALLACAATALGAHAALMHALTMATPSIQGIPTLLAARDLAFIVAGLGSVGLAFTVRKRPMAALPCVLVLVACFGLVPAALEERALHPQPLTPSSVPHPPGEASRLYGACVIHTDGSMAPHGPSSKSHHMVGCDEDPDRVEVLSVDLETPLADLERPKRWSVNLLTHLGPLPKRLTAWGNTTYNLPLWRANEGPKALVGSFVVDLGPPLEIIGNRESAVGPGSRMTTLEEALQRSGRIELLILPRNHSVGDLLSFCTEAVRMRPLATRCGLALGQDAAAIEGWKARALIPSKGPELEF